MRQDNVLALSSEIIWQQAKEALDRVKEAFKAILKAISDALKRIADLFEKIKAHIILLRTLQTRYSVVLYNAQHHKKARVRKNNANRLKRILRGYLNGTFA